MPDYMSAGSQYSDSTWIEEEERVSNLKLPIDLKEDTGEQVEQIKNFISAILWIKKLSEVYFDSHWLPIWFREGIVDLLETKQLIDGWSEGEIYSIEIWDKEYVIAKELRWNTWEREYRLLEELYKYTSENNIGITSPTPIAFFKKNGDEYIIMEKIKWKTLLCKRYETYMNSVLDECVNEYGKNEWKRIIQEHFSYMYGYENWKFNLKSTASSKNVIIKFLQEIEHISTTSHPWFDKKTCGFEVTDTHIVKLDWSNKIYPSVKVFVWNISKRVKVFTEDEWNILSNKMIKAVNFLREKNFVLWDHWRNPWNWMVFLDKNEGIQLAAIDTWKSSSPKNPIWWWDGDDENLMAWTIKYWSWKTEWLKKEKRLIEREDIESMISISKGVWGKLWEKLGLWEEYLDEMNVKKWLNGFNINTLYRYLGYVSVDAENKRQAKGVYFKERRKDDIRLDLEKDKEFSIYTARYLFFICYVSVVSGWDISLKIEEFKDAKWKGALRKNKIWKILEELINAIKEELK